MLSNVHPRQLPESGKRRDLPRHDRHADRPPRKRCSSPCRRASPRTAPALLPRRSSPSPVSGINMYQFPDWNPTPNGSSSMSIRNLDLLFKPRSIALIGASKARASMGAVLAYNLFNSGFTGPIMPVNPKHRAIEGVLTYPDAAALPVVPDLAVIATPPDAVPGLVEAFGAHGTRGIVVITAGFGEGGDERGEALRQQMLDAAR